MFIFRHIGARLLRIPVDDYGIDTDFLEEALKRETIKAVYIIPHADGSFYNNEVYSPNGLRLGFASLNEQEIEESLKLLRKII